MNPALIALTDQQREIVLDTTKYRVIVGPRRFGKSTIIAADILNSGLSIPGGFSLLLNPFQDQSFKFYNQTFIQGTNIHRFFAKAPKTHPFPMITFRGGHQTSMKTWANHAGQLGGYLNRCWLDESADYESDTVFRVLQPMLADKRGLMLITGSVSTETSFLWSMFLRGQGSNPRFKSWRFTWKDAIVFRGKAGEQELQDAYDTMSYTDFQTQYEVIPVGDDNMAFGKLSRCVVDVEPPTEPQAGRRYSMAVDLGGKGKDFTYAVIVDDSGLVVYEEQFPMGLDYAVYAERCAALARFWGVGVYTVDGSGCGGSGGQRTTEDSIVKFYREAYPTGVHAFTWSGNDSYQSKHQVVQFFACLTEEKTRHKDLAGEVVELPKLRIPRRFDRLIRQLQAYRMKVSKTTGQMQYQGKFGHDDGASACILCCYRAFKHLAFGKRHGDIAIRVDPVQAFVQSARPKPNPDLRQMTEVIRQI